MKVRPLSSRQYITEAWSPLTVEVDGDSMLCNFNPDLQLGPDATLCVIPTQAKAVVEDPVRMKVKPNVMSEWLDRLTAAGASILLVHGRWYDDLWRLAEQVRAGTDGFAGMERRVRAAVRESLERDYARPGKVVVMGSSRHAFAILHSMANNPDVSAAVAHQPIVWWPRMEEFAGMEADPIVNRHSLYDWPARFVPRPLLIQTGYADQRVGQDRLEALIKPLSEAYRSHSLESRFTHELMDMPGHDGTRVPDSALDSVVTWLRSQGLL